MVMSSTTTSGFELRRRFEQIQTVANRADDVEHAIEQVDGLRQQGDMIIRQQHSRGFGQSIHELVEY